MVVVWIASITSGGTSTIQLVLFWFGCFSLTNSRLPGYYQQYNQYALYQYQQRRHRIRFQPTVRSQKFENYWLHVSVLPIFFEN